MDITLICSLHHKSIDSLSGKFISDFHQYEEWSGWDSLAERIKHFITTYGHEEIENTILNPDSNGERHVIWKATRFDGKYHKIIFNKVVRDEYEQV